MSQTRADFFAEAYSKKDILPFVYCYPPRTAHLSKEAPIDLQALWSQDGLSSQDLNIYIHIPFCFYKCSFCSLYTIKARRDEDGLFDAYVLRLNSDLLELARSLEGRQIRTIFIGGGTPFSLGVPRLVQILANLGDVFPNWRRTVAEVTVEGSPDSILAAEHQLADLVAAGVDRVSMGVQSLDPVEVRRAGRASAGPEIVAKALSALRVGGVRNIGVDLIVGLEDQTDASFDATLVNAIELKPETLSIYLINPRVGTGFERRNAPTSNGNHSLYKRLERASRDLRNAGYDRESSVQFKLPGKGGLLHKQLYFGGISVLGLGAGARSYTAFNDYVTGGGARGRDSIKEYITRPNGYVAVSRGAFITKDESQRRRVILGLHGLHVRDIPSSIDGEWDEPYGSVLVQAMELGLLEMVDERLMLTEQGFIYRDLICWSMFSDEMLQRHSSEGSDYTDLQRFVQIA